MAMVLLTLTQDYLQELNKNLILNTTWQNK